MYVEIEPSGCSERNGMLQIRLAMYLDEGDYGYDKRYLPFPTVPEGGFLKGYPGKKTENGSPVDYDAFKRWHDKLPKEYHNTDFHNHFIYVATGTTNEEIMDIAEAFLHEAYIKWSCGEKMDLTNSALEFDHSRHDKEKMPSRLDEIKSAKLIRRIK